MTNNNSASRFVLLSIAVAAGLTACAPDTPACSSDADCGSDEVCVDDGYCDLASEESWTCDMALFGTGDGCDCGCGAEDPDCGGEGCSDVGCAAASCEYCSDAGGSLVACDDGGGEVTCGSSGDSCSADSDCCVALCCGGLDGCC